MSDTMDAATLAARRLTSALEQVSDALGTADLDALLAAESGVAAAVAAFRPPFSPPADPGACAAETAALERALSRCRRLGRSLDTFAHTVLTSADPAASYDRGGRERGEQTGAPAPVWEARI
ncbi:MAG: hypothetical protein Q8L86_03785 [Vicinamibacterales bacterium]|nr:hypothetical protein [Vicinamibacterales bacterium]